MQTSKEKYRPSGQPSRHRVLNWKRQSTCLKRQCAASDSSEKEILLLPSLHRKKQQPLRANATVWSDGRQVLQHGMQPPREKQKHITPRQARKRMKKPSTKNFVLSFQQNRNQTPAEAKSGNSLDVRKKRQPGMLNRKHGLQHNDPKPVGGMNSMPSSGQPTGKSSVTSHRASPLQ